MLEPRIHIAGIQLQVCINAIIRQMLLLLNLYHPAVNQLFCVIICESGISDGAIASPNLQIAFRQFQRLVFQKQQHLRQRIAIGKLLILRSNSPVYGIAEQQIHFIKGQRMEIQRLFQAGVIL